MNQHFTSLVVLFLFLSFSTLYAEEHSKTFNLCYEDQDYPPYLTGDSEKPSMPNPGVLVELSKMAFEKVGLSVNYIRRPWKRCMRMVQENKAAGMFGVIYRPEREKVGRYPMKGDEPDASRRLLNVDYPIFTHRINSVDWDGQSFSDKQIKLGTPLGYATVKSLQEEQTIEPNTSFLPEAGLRLVSEGKLDGYILEKNVGLSILKKQNLTDHVVVHNPPFKRHDLYLLLSHGFYNTHKDSAEQIWSHLAVFRETLLDDLMLKYMKR